MIAASADRCFDVAIDHGMFNERTFLGGIEDMHKAIRIVADAKPDAIQLPPGTAPILQAIPGKDRPALVLRTDIANVYGTPLPRVLFSEVIDRPLEQAMALDAACVVVNLLMLPDQPEVYRACIRNVNALKRECDIMGMPLMVEPLVMQDNSKGGYMVDGDISKILPLVRQAAELGADIIKAEAQSEHWLAACWRPILMLTFGLLIVGLSLTGLETKTAMTSAWTAIANIGPAWGPEITANGSVVNFPESAKWLMIFGMFVGRLELLSVYVLFLPRFWRS